MLKPTIHSQGTDGEELYAAAQEALAKLQAADAAVCAITPRVRDFAPQGDRAFWDASERHSLMLNALRRVTAEVAAYMVDVRTALEARETDRRR